MKAFAILLALFTLGLASDRNNDGDNNMIYFVCDSDANCGGPDARCAKVTIEYHPTEEPDTFKVYESDFTCVDKDKCNDYVRHKSPAGPDDKDKVYVTVSDCLEASSIKNHWFLYTIPCTLLLIIGSLVYYLIKKRKFVSE